MLLLFFFSPRVPPLKNSKLIRPALQVHLNSARRVCRFPAGPFWPRPLGGTAARFMRGTEAGDVNTPHSRGSGVIPYLMAVSEGERQRGG